MQRVLRPVRNCGSLVESFAPLRIFSPLQLTLENPPTTQHTLSPLTMGEHRVSINALNPQLPMTRSDKALLVTVLKLLAYRLAQFAIFTVSLGLMAFVVYHVMAFGPTNW